MSGREAGTRLQPQSIRTRWKSRRERLTKSSRDAVPSLANEEDLRKALEQAFDYRGDVSITRKDGSRIEGYIFDRSSGDQLARQLRALVAERRISQDKDLLRRDCGAGFYRPRYGCRQELGKLGAPLLGEESRRRERISRCSQRSWSRALSCQLSAFSKCTLS